MMATNVRCYPVIQATLPALLVYLLLGNQAAVAEVGCSAGLGVQPIGDLEAYSEAVCGGSTRRPHSQSVNSASAEFFGGSVYCEYNPWWDDEWYYHPYGHPYLCQMGDFYVDANDLRRDDQADGEECPSSNHPINLVNGNKYKIHTDIPGDLEGSSLKKPAFTRTYNSQNVRSAPSEIGLNWLHNYQRTLTRSNAYRSGVNQNVGDRFVPAQSSTYTTAAQACIDGFNELVTNAASYPSVFGSHNRLKNGMAHWDFNSNCEIRDANGRYITTIPIKSHFATSSGGDLTRWVKLLRPDGDEYRFRRDLLDNHQGSYTWQSESPGVRGVLQQLVNEEVIDGVPMLITTYVFTDENDVKETYAYSGELLKIEYPNELTETLEYIDGRLDRVINDIGHSLQFTYTPIGRVHTVSDEAGRTWEYGYDTYGRLVIVINPDGTTKTYHYEDENQATALTGLTDERDIRYSSFEYYPDGLAKSSYLGAPGALPELRIDDVSLTYSNTFNTVTNSRGFASKYHFSTDVLQGLMTQYDGPECAGCAGGSKSYDHDLDSLNLLGKTEYGQNIVFENYDENGNPGVVTEAVATPEERATTYTYDQRYQDKVETITEPSVYTAGNKLTTYTYDDFGNTTSITITGYRPDGTPVSRTQSFTYSGPYQQLSEIDGPRTDVADITIMEYYADDALEGHNRARLKKVTAPLGVVLYDNISYTATGKQASYTTGNDLQVDFTYYPGNDRLQTQTQTDLSSGEARTTRWTYIATGEVESITQGYATPEATTVTFEYDDARRLTRIYDGFNNYLEYTLDTEGNVINENIYDQGGILLKALNQSFDAYNRLDISTQENETRDRDFAPDGTLDLETDGKNVVTDYSYDALRRLTSITQDVGGTDPSSANALTQLGYDVHDNLVSVTDPNGGHTGYVYDDLGNLLSLSSPDTGTASYTHDEAGNIASMIDARGQLFSYSYDALGRLTLADAPGATDDVAYVYDSCENGVGKLCSVTRDVTTVTYAYTAFGDIKSSMQTVATFPSYEQALAHVAYSYDAAGRVSDMTYPGGNKVNYTYDANGNVYSVILNDGEVNLVTGSQYYPFGPVRQYMRGNGSAIFGHRDRAYRPFVIGNGGYFYDVIYYDANGNPATFYSSEGNKVHGYDALDRLDTSTGPFGARDYGYDNNGNRTSKQANSVTDSYSYDLNSNRMNTNAGSAVVLDANGNTTSQYGMALSYTADNRLGMIAGRAGYTYNGRGERVMKGLLAPRTAGAYGYKLKTVYVYGPDGQLLAELGSSGKVKQEYIYMNDELLATIVYQPSGGEPILNADMDSDGAIGVDDFLVWYFNHYNSGDLTRDVNGDGLLDTNDLNVVLNCALSGGTGAGCTSAGYSQAIYYAHNDHLGTPHVLSDETGGMVWSATYDPFGRATVNDDHDGDGNTVTLNNRFPGQYYDAESGLHYNYFRYYDPVTGRYITSDPIGLDGGLNTYGYVGGNPLRWIDPKGLWSLTVQAYGGPGGAVNITYFNGTLEVTGRIGVGLGIGIEYNPTSEPSPHSKFCGNGYIARTTTQLGVNYGLGVAGVGAGFVGASGNAVTHKVGGGYAEVNAPQVSIDGKAGFGFSATANVGVDIGSYSNW